MESTGAKANPKKIIVLSACAVLIFFVGYFVGDAEAISRVNASISGDTSSLASLTASSTSSTEGSEKVTEYKKGETGQVGNWKINISDVQTGTEIKSDSGDTSDNKTSSQLFVMVKVQLENTASTPQSYSSDEFALGNLKNESVYALDMEAGEVLNDNKTNWENDSTYFGIYDNLNPNLPKYTYLVFEVPAGTSVSDLILASTKANENTEFYLS